jgi:UDP-N-acetylmuramoyl-tripeptide--D-alanyl-D-alanine ligase
VPLSLARMPEDVAFGVLELGMNHAGELAALTRIARPHVAVITTVAAAHLEFFSSIEAIADAKCEIFAGLEPGGTAILNVDIPYFDRMRAHAGRSPADHIVTFGEHPAADWRLLELRLSPTDGEMVVLHRGRRLAYRLGTPGRHAALNSLAVLAAVEALGGDPELAAVSLSGLRPSSGRGARRRIELAGGEALLLDETYNANPASMTAALAVLGQQEGRRVAVLGDMLELGDQGSALHAALIEPVLAAGVDLVFSCGPLMAHLNAALPPSRRGAHAADAAALAPIVREALRPGDVLLIKGSLGSRMARVLEALPPLDEPEVQRDGS